MGLAIAPYTEEWQPAVRAFNQRLAQAGIGFQFPDRDACTSHETTPIVHRGFVAVQDGEIVRGGYLVQEQDFLLDGRRERLGYLHLPLSEGLIDRRYSMLGVQLIAHALKRQPLLFGLGIGSRDEAFAKVVLALGWQLQPVPFLFKILRPARVARGLPAIRRTAVRRAACEVAAASGAAAIATWALQARVGSTRGAADRQLTQVADFDAVADELWERHRHHYHLIGWRDAASLGQLYPHHHARYLRWQSTSAAGASGWAVTLDTQMSGHKYFGDLRVGTIVDCFGDPASAPSLIRDVTNALAARGVDLIVSNQASRVWTSALRQAGFLERPSNYLFAASPALFKKLASQAGNLSAFHLTRGDGDGPINL